ncbi:hypothetical protein, partial [Ruegeria haliotis]|uniref:hypothetical protein n=1 Tax=Ruegeria haliotis TaxID=2747601 RepID=UPI001B7D8869
MLTSTKQNLGAIVAVPFFGIVMISSAAADPGTCNWKTARNLANSGDYAALCDCAQVTPSFLERLQKRSDFETTLSVTSAQCPGLAALLTDLPTASLSNAADRRGEDRSSDPGGTSVADNGGNAGGPGNDGGNPGNGGGGDGGGNGGGGDGGGNGGGGDGGGNGGGGDGGGNGGGGDGGG